MYQYPEKAITEATHTDDNGYMYKMISNSLVLYWDRRFDGWYQEQTKDFSFLRLLNK
jgi:hypothetical protein